jgi:hypothetical protein
MMPYRVVSVRPLEHLRLAVRFADGLSGDVAFKESHLYGVFEALKDPRVFAEVHCRQGFVEWPGEIDLAPDAMYDEIKASGILSDTSLRASPDLDFAFFGGTAQKGTCR